MMPFVPPMLPLQNFDWAKFVHLVGTANRAVARYDGQLQNMPNPEILLSPLTTQEAVLSSKIEGTQASLNDVLQYEANPSPTRPRVNDIIETINYRRALTGAVKQMKTLPLSLRVVRDAHVTLMQGARGMQGAPGEFRKIQNWIGKPGSTIETATYVPPPPNEVMNLLDNLEKYIHYEEKDVLVQLAVIHSQFEMIHPFLDGNGRIGRILIPLFLYHKGVLNRPMFYISAFFESHRDLYYDKLLSVSRDGAWEDWIEFFLHAVIEQATTNSEKAKSVTQLYEKLKTRIEELTHSQYAMRVLDSIFNRPVFRIGDFVTATKIPRNSAPGILSKLVKGKVLNQIVSKGRAGNIYVLSSLIRIVR